MMKVAVTQYKLEKFANFKNYQNKIQSLVIEAKKLNANLLLLPEYAGIEIAGFHNTDKELFAAIQPLIPDYLNLFTDLAHKYQIFIQSGTILVESESEKYVNRAYLFSPNGKVAYQDKLHLVESEKSSNLIQCGDSQNIFETELGKIGIAVCYDSEFPEVVRTLVDAGAVIILVPSYCVSLASYYRVFLSCRARALENQCFLAVSYIVGEVSLSHPYENTTGTAAIFGPVEESFSNNGILARGQINEIGLITADVDFNKIDVIRAQGQTRNFYDRKQFYNLKSNVASVKI